nr:MAG TPA: hypothetical protein [Caudoviricetes sp.]
MPDVETKNEPCIFAGSLSDKELIPFLEGVVLELMSRSRLTGEPEALREQALKAEDRLRSINESINSVVRQQILDPGTKTSGGEQAGLVMTPRQKVDLAAELIAFVEKKAKESNYTLSGSDFWKVLELAAILK